MRYRTCNTSIAMTASHETSTLCADQGETPHQPAAHMLCPLHRRGRTQAKSLVVKSIAFAQFRRAHASLRAYAIACCTCRRVVCQVRHDDARDDRCRCTRRSSTALECTSFSCACVDLQVELAVCDDGPASVFWLHRASAADFTHRRNGLAGTASLRRRASQERPRYGAVMAAS